MATVTIYPTAIDFGTSTVLTLVGGIGGLSDGSDATYLGISNTDGVNVRNVKITFEPHGIPDGELVDVAIAARFQQLGGLADAAPSLSMPFDGGGALVLGYLRENYATPGGPVVDLSGTTSTVGSTDVNDVWTLGMSRDGTRTTSDDFRLYELAITLTYEGEPPPTVLARPALRRYPRDDALGFGGVKRTYPPPRGRRIVGGQP